VTLSEVATAVRPYTEDYYRTRQGSPHFRIEVAHALRLLRPRPGQRLLEPGCGAGALLSAAAARGALVVGLDVNEDALRIAAQSGDALFADAERLPFSDHSFDAAIAQHVIEHFATPERLLREWHRVLAPGGRLVLLTPNEGYGDPSIYFDPTHRLIYSRRRLRRALADAGFRVERDYTLFPYLGWPRLARVARRLLWLRWLPWFRERGATILVRARGI
jgi:ubiquinone/menaquinone biosynthesis C-methylase UbiE